MNSTDSRNSWGVGPKQHASTVSEYKPREKKRKQQRWPVYPDNSCYFWLWMRLSLYQMMAINFSARCTLSLYSANFASRWTSRKHQWFKCQLFFSFSQPVCLNTILFFTFSLKMFSHYVLHVNCIYIPPGDDIIEHEYINVFSIDIQHLCHGRKEGSVLFYRCTQHILFTVIWHRTYGKEPLR